ncbi:MAG: hypothetical protein R3E55_02195 [Burkholderiaceae bacterium]
MVEPDRDIERLIGIPDLAGSAPDRVDAFIVTDNGRYIGLGTGDKLVRADRSTHRSARHANPLPSCPATFPSVRAHRAPARERQPLCRPYADLNHFKPFNDLYGYWRADDDPVGASIVSHRNGQCDFVGHVGGDDFLVLSPE